MATNFNIFFGRVEYVVKAAPGTGIVSSMVMLSDDLDEIDWEFRGGITDSVQTNYFGKGYTGTYNRSTTVTVASPQAQFHTYAVDWSKEALIWSIDGKAIRTLKASEADGNGDQYPQTPMKISLSLWDGGDPDKDPNTISWAGGKTPIPPPQPYTMFVSKVSIWNSNPAQQYKYTDKSGSWESIESSNETMAESSAPPNKTQTLNLAPYSANGTVMPSPTKLSNQTVTTLANGTICTLSKQPKSPHHAHKSSMAKPTPPYGNSTRFANATMFATELPPRPHKLRICTLEPPLPSFTREQQSLQLASAQQVVTVQAARCLQ